MRGVFWLLLLALTAGCADERARPNSALRQQDTAVPDERTAILISLSVFQGILKRDIGDFRELSTHLTASLRHDPQGDVWVVKQKQDEFEEFIKRCAGQCIGGEFYIMTIAQHDGRILEVYIPQ